MRLNWKSPWRGAAFLFCLPNPRKVRDVANAEEILEWDRGCGPSSLPSHFLHYLQLPRVTSLAEAQLKFRVGTRVLLWHAQLRKQQHGTHRGGLLAVVSRLNSENGRTATRRFHSCTCWTACWILFRSPGLVSGVRKALSDTWPAPVRVPGVQAWWLGSASRSPRRTPRGARPRAGTRSTTSRAPSRWRCAPLPCRRLKLGLQSRSC